MNPYNELLNSFEKVFKEPEAIKLQNYWNMYFQNTLPITLEIGTGFGGFALKYIEQNVLKENFIGLDYRFKRSFRLMKKLQKNLSSDYAFISSNATKIHLFFGPEEISQVFLLFSDPWPKKRHQKHRLCQDWFFTLLHPLLKKGARIFIKTDNTDYFSFIQTQSFQGYSVVFQTESLYEEETIPPHLLIKTDFEKFFLEEGQSIKAMILEKK